MESPHQTLLSVVERGVVVTPMTSLLTERLCLCVPAAQLEFVQILVIVVVMMVMVVVITCLLNHYRLSARSLLSGHAPARRRHLPLANVSSSGCRCGFSILDLTREE